MQRFSIDYITGSGSQPAPLNMAQITFANHDGVMSKDGSNYLNNSLHLEDVYSVISRDVACHVALNGVNGYNSMNSDPQYYTDQNHVQDLTAVTTEVETHVETPVCSPLTSTSGTSDTDTSDRQTPSPHRDSGIESDISPVAVQHNTKSEEKTSDKKKTTAAGKKKTDEKPGESYVELIARAILSSTDDKMALGDIYRYVAENYKYYDNEEKSWRNSIRYNLSINECFVKAGKEESGKGNYWAIHQNCLNDFKRGDFRRRQARRRARRNLKTIGSHDVCHKTGPPNVNAYVQMTPSFAGYQPYPNIYARQHHHQQMTSQHLSYAAPPDGNFFSQAPRYPVSNYTPMSLPGHSSVYNPQETDAVVKPAPTMQTDMQRLYSVYRDLFDKTSETQVTSRDWLLKPEIPDENRIVIS